MKQIEEKINFWNELSEFYQEETFWKKFYGRNSSEKEKEGNNLRRTENGAYGFASSGYRLVDFNFAASSMRNWEEARIAAEFVEVVKENPLYAIKWLFYASDVRGGMGERRLFRICFRQLAQMLPQTTKALLPLVSVYSRWDNLFVLLGTSLEKDVVALIQNQLAQDEQNMAENKSISLLAKWMPSVNTSSEETRKQAKYLVKQLGLTEAQYRKKLVALRKYLQIVETLMSKKQWAWIDYSAVPSKANLLYADAFMRHDQLRREQFLEQVRAGETKIHAGVLFPHELVQRYHYYYQVKDYDATLEELWKALPDFTNGAGNTLVVADGSGSMTCEIQGTATTALDVANGLAFYFAERCTGQFHNHYITFSEHPQLVDLSGAETLRDKLLVAEEHCEVANTNIEAVFLLLLETAQRNQMSQEDFPQCILILSDMEFDRAVVTNDGFDVSETLFAQLREKYASCGYQLPKLVFWNILSRTQAIPVTENELGVALVSGFSPSALKAVFSQKLEPLEILLDLLDSERYNLVDEALQAIQFAAESQ